MLCLKGRRNYSQCWHYLAHVHSSIFTPNTDLDIFPLSVKKTRHSKYFEASRSSSRGCRDRRGRWNCRECRSYRGRRNRRSGERSRRMRATVRVRRSDRSTRRRGEATIPISDFSPSKVQGKRDNNTGRRRSRTHCILHRRPSSPSTCRRLSSIRRQCWPRLH
jgi:hypothetical protein